MNRLCLIISAVVALTACSQEPALRPLDQQAVILAFGDSLTYGTGARRDESYPAVLEALTGRVVVNAGVPGEVSSRGLERLPELIAKHRPDLLILIHGGNDLLRRQSHSRAADNLTAMIEAARTRDIEVLLIGVPKPGLILETAALYKEVATRTLTPVDDGIIASVLQYPANKSDAVHPNARGYQKMAEDIRDLLVTYGAL